MMSRNARAFEPKRRRSVTLSLSDQMQRSLNIDSEFDRALSAVQAAVTRGYVLSQRSSNEFAPAELERLLVTLLAALLNNPKSAKESEHRAEELADLLVRCVRETHRTAHPRTPVQFRAWPPTPSRKISDLGWCRFPSVCFDEAVR
jgi:hypothetical protein